MSKKEKSKMTYAERIAYDLDKMTPDSKSDMFLYSCIQLCKLHLEGKHNELSMNFNYRVNGKQDYFVATIKRVNKNNQKKKLGEQK